MKRLLLITVSVMLLTAFFAFSASPAAARETKLLEFDTMVGVPATLTGTQASAAFRGVNAGGLPWTLTSARGELKASGKLEIEIKGLVFAAGPNIGKNTVTSFRALVSCIGSDGLPHNVLTDPFPATTGAAVAGGGNASIEAIVALPQPCFAPIVFVTSPAGSWFAVTGN
jgi:hypothetical protein